MNPNISVIIPYYDGAKWLPVSLASVQQQQDVLWELIVVDDGSKEDPYPIFQSMQDERVRLFRIPHAGKGSALNFGVAESKADTICFLDQDDIMVPGRLKLQYDVVANDPHVDVVYSDYARIYDDGRVIDSFISHQASNQECLRRMAKSSALVSMQTIMLRKQIYTQIGGFSNDIQLTGLDDAEFFVRLFTSNAVLRYVPGIVQKWVSHERNYSKSEDFHETRLIFLNHLYNLAKNNSLLQKELPMFQYHTFSMRGLYFLESGNANKAVVEFMKAIHANPINLNAYYLFVKSFIKRLVQSD